MFVPNYVPEPESIADNVTQECYRIRLEFIRRVLIKFGVACVVTVLAGALMPKFGNPLLATILLAGFLTLASGIRTAMRGKPVEPKIAVVLLPMILILIAWMGRCWISSGVPLWSVSIGLACFMIYAAVCGRDFSFVGGYVLSMIASSIVIATVLIALKMSTLQSTVAVAFNLIVTLYLIYDLASLLARRRVSESWAAVTDLFRDCLNVVGYVPRLMLHWRRYRILDDLPFEIPFRTS